MTEQKNNIFEIGRVVTGNSFIGRKTLLDEYINMVYGGGKKPCLSIIGVPRSGKTSFAKKLLDFECNDTIKIYIDLGTLKEFKDLWVYFVQKCLSCCRKLQKDNTELENIAKEIYSTDNYILLKSSVESFLECLADINERVILVIDEFDAATKVFQGEDSYFEFCREVFSNGRFLLTVIVISRKMLSTIVKEAYQTSTFSGIFYTQYFKGFNAIDMEEYWNVFKKEEIILSEEQKNNIIYYAGNSPYLLSILGYNIINTINMGKPIDIDFIFQNDCKLINEYYRNIINHLDRDGSKDKLMAIVIGPKYRITRHDKEDLKNLGYLVDDGEEYMENTPFITFSHYFTEFLRIEQKANTPIWPELIGVEKLLKQIIRKELQQLFSSKNFKNQRDLIQSIITCNVEDTLNMLDSFIKDSSKKFSREVDYIDVISLKQACDIIKKYWAEFFSRYFNYDDISIWEEKFKACGKARNPIAHGHEDYLSIEECNQITSYCQEIHKIITSNFF